MTGARIVFDVHEDIPLDIISKEWIPRPLRKPVSRMAAFALRMLHRRYSAIVAATPSIAPNFDEKNTVVVCNYPTLEGSSAANAPIALRPTSAVYAGNITELRGLYEMLEALESPEIGSHVRLTLIGKFENAELERRARAMKGWERVDYLGWCAPSDVPDVLTRARVGMLVLRYTPSFTESLPTKLYEYMGAGLPVIVSEFLQCSELVREHQFGIVVDPSDADALARAMTYLIENPAEAQAMGERGRTLVNERYQWKSEATKLTRLYATIA
jgi:glycosyltransferase involved in cell wall biosynthesis